MRVVQGEGMASELEPIASAAKIYKALQRLEAKGFYVETGGEGMSHWLVIGRVVDMMRERGFTFECEWNPSKDPVVSFDNHNDSHINIVIGRPTLLEAVLAAAELALR